MSDLIQSIALSGIPPKGGKDFVSPTGEQFITAGPTREEIRAKSPDRGVFGAINDNVIEIANAAAGGVSSIANMVSPGNRASKFIDEEIIKPGEEAQSDMVKAEKRMLRQDLENAKGATDEIGAYLSYMANNPGLAISQVAGSFAIPGIAAKGATKLAGAAGLGQKAASRFGLGTVSAVSGAMAGGDAAGTAYDLVKRTPKKILEQNAEYQDLVEQMGEDQALEEIATRAARNASALPAAIGATLGPLGAERIMAGAGRAMTASRIKNAGITGGIEAGTEGFEEGATQYSGQKAAAEYNPTIDPMKGVAGAATMGAVMGAGPGLVTGALETPATPDPLKVVADKAAEPNSPLSKAALAGASAQGVLQQATNVSPDGTPADPISGRVAAVESLLRSSNTLEKLRAMGPQMGAENLTNDFLYALQVARNPNSRPDQREAAIAQAEQAIEWTRSGFTTPAPEAPKAPGTDLAVRREGQLGPVGQAQFFDPNTIDVDSVRVDNMLPGPRALPGPRPALSAPQGVSQTEQTSSFVPNDQQNVAEQTIPAVDQTTGSAPSSIAGMSEVQAPAVQTPAGAGPAATRKRKAVLEQLVGNGFETVERDGKDFWLINSKTGQKFKLDGAADAQMARNQIQKSIRAQADVSPNSPRNDLKESTPAQNKAGNYAKPPVSLNGFTIRIENPVGSMRRGVDKDGVAWESEIKSDYGYIEGTKAKDGDGVDVLIGNRADSSKIFVIDQVNPDGKFDEPKVVMGVTDEDHARRTYLANYEPGWTGLGAITEMTREQFNDWLKSGGPMKATALGKKAAAQPAAEQGDQKARWIKAITDQNRLAGSTGIQLDVTKDGKLNFLGDPNSTKQGRQLLATLEEARKAGATNKEIADAVRATRQFAQGVDNKRQGAFNTLEEAKQYLSQQRRANGSVSGLPLQLADGSFTVAIKGTAPYAEAERQRDERDRIAQGDFFTVQDAGKPKRVKRVKKSELPKKAASVRRLGEPRALTQEEAGLIEQIAAVLGKRVVFFQAQEGRIGDGFFDPTQPDTLFVASETTVNPLAVFGHEFFHDLRETNPEAWNAIAAVVRARVADPKGFRSDYYGDKAAEQRGDAPLSTEKGGELEELVSDLGGNLMMDATFWRDVFAKIQEDSGADGKGIIARLAAALEQFVARVVNAMKQSGFRADAFVSDLGEVRKAYRDGLADFIKAAGMRQASMAAEIKRAEQDIKKSTDKSDKGLTVEAYHFSKQPRAVLSTGMFGTGLQGSARDEIMNANDARLRQRLYFYVDKGTGINPEAGVGGYAHKATLSGIYDGDADPLRLKSGGARAFESKVLDAGFKGYLTRMEGTQSGQVILLGAQTIQPELLGTGKVTGAKVVPAPQVRDQDLADRILANKALPSGMLSPQRWSEVLMAQDPELAAQLLDIGALTEGQGMYKDELAAKVRKIMGSESGAKGPQAAGIVFRAADTGRILLAKRSSQVANPGTWSIPGGAVDEGESLVDAAMREAREEIGYTGEITLEPVSSVKFGQATYNTFIATVPSEFETSLNWESSGAQWFSPDALPSGLHPGFERAKAKIVEAAKKPVGITKQQLADAAKSLAPEIRRSADRAKSEYAEVEAKYKGTDQWMKAPDGTATKLSERQWVQVRTPSFKKWFGDWEQAHKDGGVWATSLDVSKAVSENGEPLVVYHGTDKGGFVEFETPSGRGRGDLGIFTTPDYEMARSYVRKNRAQDIELPADPQNKADLEQLGYSFDENDEGQVEVTTPDGYFEGAFDTEQEAVEYALDNLSMPDLAGTQPGIYALFVNLRNPLEDSFEGATWSGQPDGGKVEVLNEESEPVYNEDGSRFFDQDEADRLVGENPGYEIIAAGDLGKTTDDVVSDARRYNNDGAIIRDVIDDGGGRSNYWGDPQDIFVALSPEQLKSADYNNGEFSDSTGDIRKSRDRLTRVDPFEMSTRIPTAKGKVVEDHMGDLLISDFAAGKTQEKWVNSVANLVSVYPNYREADSANTPAKKLERIVRHMVENLVWLHNQVPADTRQRSKLWYDGANRIAQRMSRKYELTQAQSAGILAVLSPQKDWFMNVSLGERVASIMAERQNFQWSKEMESTAKRIYGDAKYQEDVDAIRGKSLSDLDGDAYLQAMWLRTYDQAHNSSSFSIVSPEGDSLAIAKAKTGKPVKVAWGGNSTIAKAISIFDDGSVDNISGQLGTKHKVRNFFNNILVPRSRNGHVTIDTHAVAAALLRPLSGNSLEVMQNFGGTSNAITGLQGAYALYEEAYRRAAEELDLLPRELQSITWEAVRGLFVPTFKSQQKNVDGIDKIWTQFKKGRLSYDGAREWVLESAGGIEPPSWLGRDPGAYVEDESALEPGDLSDDGVSRRGAEDAVIRAMVDDSGAAQEGVRKSGDRARREEAGGAARGPLEASERADAQEALSPLPGAPRVEGFTGPDPRLVAVAGQYARDNGIELRRQAEYVDVDVDRAERIAQAYAEMKHDPQNPRVKAAYKNLIKQTLAQYRALEAAGYKFWFMDMSRPDNQDYASSPWNAMRDIRANKEMGVFPTADGFGTSEDFSPDNNPLLADTGIKWPVGAADSDKTAPVYANDLFRAVHDAFGHGLEGSGFRARGEENAWQAHVRLFTGSAVAAITTETRGQNSWLNYGPYGEKNRTAKVEDTVFADQKTGLMPEWTWSEGRVGDMPTDSNSSYNQRVAALKDLIACLKK